VLWEEPPFDSQPMQSAVPRDRTPSQQEKPSDGPQTTSENDCPSVQQSSVHGHCEARPQPQGIAKEQQKRPQTMAGMYEGHFHARARIQKGVLGEAQAPQEHLYNVPLRPPSHLSATGSASRAWAMQRSGPESTPGRVYPEQGQHHEQQATPWWPSKEWSHKAMTGTTRGKDNPLVIGASLREIKGHDERETTGRAKSVSIAESSQQRWSIPCRHAAAAEQSSDPFPVAVMTRPSTQMSVMSGHGGNTMKQPELHARSHSRLRESWGWGAGKAGVFCMQTPVRSNLHLAGQYWQTT